MKAFNFHHWAAAANATLLLALAGDPLRADDHGSTSTTATRIGSGVTLGAIETAIDRDWFVFRPTQGGIATVTLLPKTPGAIQGRFFFELFDATMRRVANSYGDSMKYAVLPGGPYFVQIRKLANMNTSPRDYRLKLSLPEGATPFPLTSNILSGSLETANDINLFTFVQPAPGLINVTTRPVSATSAPIKLFLELYDGAGNRRGYAWSGGDIRLVLNQPGRYFVRVTPGTTAPNTGRYAVQICTNARATAVAGFYSGNFDVPQDRDYLRFEVNGTRRVRLSSSGAPRIRATLYDSAGNRKALSNFTSLSIQIDQILTGGSYYLLLEPTTAPVKTGPYRVTIAK